MIMMSLNCILRHLTQICYWHLFDAVYLLLYFACFLEVGAH